MPPPDWPVATPDGQVYAHAAQRLVVVAGVEHRVPRTAAQLVALLVAAHPAPVTLRDLAWRFWPPPFDAARARRLVYGAERALPGLLRWAGPDALALHGRAG